MLHPFPAHDCYIWASPALGLGCRPAALQLLSATPGSQSSLPTSPACCSPLRSSPYFPLPSTALMHYTKEFPEDDDDIKALQDAFAELYGASGNTGGSCHCRGPLGPALHVFFARGFLAWAGLHAFCSEFLAFPTPSSPPICIHALITPSTLHGAPYSLRSNRSGDLAICWPARRATGETGFAGGAGLATAVAASPNHRHTSQTGPAPRCRRRQPRAAIPNVKNLRLANINDSPRVTM